MSEMWIEILMYVVVFGGIFAWSMINEAKRKKWKKENPEFTVDYAAIERQKLNHLSGMTSTRDLQTRADANYKEKVRAAERKVCEENKRDSLACINCGAPLKAIYIRCDYCGLSHVEARKNQGMSRGEVDLQ